MGSLFNILKRFFCKHKKGMHVLIGTYYDQTSGIRYKKYKYICSNCGKERIYSQMWY